MYTVAKDNSVLDKNGKVILFSPSRFEKVICAGDNCFICGRSRETAKFNDEHIFPKWILRSKDLYRKSITLPNRTHINYSRYRIPCCAECNALMGDRIEQLVRSLFSHGYQAVSNHLKENGPFLFLVWLSLIFFKIYYKDVFLRLSRDLRSTPYKIADLYELKELHHIYCVARSFYSGASYDPNASCSFALVPAKRYAGFDNFDYCDLYDSQTVLLRYNQIALLAVFNDGCASQTIVGDMIRKFNGELSPIQLRELFVSLAYANQLVETRPVFRSRIRLDTHNYIITAKRLKRYRCTIWDDANYGCLLHYFCQDMIERYPSNIRNSVRNSILTGRYSFLFNENGEFISDY